MSALLQAELLKLRTTRTFFALVGSAVALSLLVVVLSVLLSDDFTEADVEDLFSVDFTSLFILLLGVMGMAGEWRHRTITGTVLAAPDRMRLLLAKILAYAVAGAALSLAVLVAVVLVGTILLSSQDQPTIGLAGIADVGWRNLAVAALLGAFGVCVGALVRNQVVAIVGLLAFSFVLEPLVFGLAPDVGRFLPTNALPGGIQDIEFFDDDAELLAPGLAVLAMLAWIAVIGGLGGLLLKRRDLV